MKIPNLWNKLSKVAVLVRYGLYQALARSSRSLMFVKIGVLKNFANFTGKHLRCSLFLIKLQAFYTP